MREDNLVRTQETRKARLLVCSSEYPPDYSSGIGNVVYDVVQQLERRGMVCEICSPVGPDIKVGSPLMIKNLGVIGLLYYWTLALAHYERHKGEFDAIWCNNPLFVKRPLLKNGLITIHTTYYGKLKSNRGSSAYDFVASAIEKHSFKRIGNNVRYTVVDPQLCDELLSIGLDDSSVDYIPNGVDCSVFKPRADKARIRGMFGLPTGHKIVLSLGRLTTPKQPRKMIEIWREIERRVDDASLVIAGGGELLDETKRLVQEYDLKRVAFLGHVDHFTEAPLLYACSDYFILTSAYEGHPLTLLEAMSSGLPCIVSDIPNLKIVRQADCGITVSMDDIRHSATEIVEYMKIDPSRHARNAREYAERNLDWEIVGGTYYRTLAGLI